MKEWQKKLSECRRSIHEMKDLLNLTEEEIRRIADIEERYPVCVPDYYLGLINPEDRDDPIRRMCIPDSMEFSEGGSPDTSGEADNTVVQGMQHKYRQTALIRPKIIVCLGRISAMQLIRPDFRISREHGQWFDKAGVRMMAIYHPAALLRDVSRRPDTFDDLKRLQAEIRAICPEVYAGA